MPKRKKSTSSEKWKQYATTGRKKPRGYNLKHPGPGKTLDEYAKFRSKKNLIQRKADVAKQITIRRSSKRRRASDMKSADAAGFRFSFGYHDMLPAEREKEDQQHALDLIRINRSISRKRKRKRKKRKK